MLKKFQDGLRQIDIFGQSINLSFRQEEQYKTSMGGFLSICIIGTIISFFYSNIINFFAKLNVTSTQEMTFSEDPDTLILDKENFMFAVQIEQDNFTTNPYFNISVEQRHYHRFPNGTQYRYPNKYIDLVPCTLQHFLPLFEKYSVNFQEQFEQQNLQNFLCPNLNFVHSRNMTVGGGWTSNDFYFLKFSVTNCVNTSESSLSWNPICKSVDEIQSTLLDKGHFRFQIYATNFLINPNRPVDYVQPYLAVDQFYNFIPDKMFVQSDIFFRTKKVTTDQGILMYPDKQNQTFAFRDYGDQREQFEISRITPNYYGAFYFQRSPYSYHINRKFLRLDELLSYLGGFTQFMIVVVGVIVRFYNRQHLIISIANDLYEFDMSSARQNTQMNFNEMIARTDRGRGMRKCKVKKNPSLVTKKLTQTPFQQQADQLQLNLQNSKSQIEKNKTIDLLQPTQQMFQSRFSATKVKSLQYFEEFKEFLKKNQKIGLSFRVILSSIIPIESLKNDQFLVLQRAINQVNKELNIEYIIKQLHELNKLKKVIFNPDQQTLFNFSRKPKIALFQDSQKRRSTQCIIDGDVTIEDYGMMRSYSDLVNSFERITVSEYDKQPQESLRLNQRLIILLGPDLMKVLEKELNVQQQQQVESQNNDQKDEENIFSERDIQIIQSN